MRRENVRKDQLLRKQFPEFTDTIALAGRRPTTEELARFWADEAARERRLADLKRAWRRKTRESQ